MNYLESFNTTIRIININMNDDLQVGISHYLGYSRKIQTGGWGYTILKKPLEFFIFLLYPWKFQTKQSLTPGSSTKLC